MEVNISRNEVSLNISKSEIALSEPDSALKKIIIKVIRWFLFSIIGGTLPLILNYLLSLIDKTKVFNLDTQLSHGELILISIAISIGTIGEMFGLKTRFRILHLISGGIGFISYVCQLLLYFSFIYIPQQNVNISSLKVLSIFFFCVTIIMGLTHLALSEVE